jgi:hypothetical protein
MAPHRKVSRQGRACPHTEHEAETSRLLLV